MRILKETYWLMGKEFLLEWKSRYAFYGLLLYLSGTVFICYLSFGSAPMEGRTWTALFWIILMFNAITTVAKSFLSEREGRLLYYYTLAAPQAIILAKLFYNGLLLSLMGLVATGLFALVIGSPIQQWGLFLALVVVGGGGLSSLLTLLSAIASRAGGNTALMAILGFPVLLPHLLLTLQVSRQCLNYAFDSAVWAPMGNLLAVDAVVVALSYILFPYLWRK